MGGPDAVNSLSHKTPRSRPRRAVTDRRPSRTTSVPTFRYAFGGQLVVKHTPLGYCEVRHFTCDDGRKDLDDVRHPEVAAKDLDNAYAPDMHVLVSRSALPSVADRTSTAVASCHCDRVVGGPPARGSELVKRTLNLGARWREL